MMRLFCTILGFDHLKCPCVKIVFLNRYFYPDHSATNQLLTDLAFDLAVGGLLFMLLPVSIVTMTRERSSLRVNPFVASRCTACGPCASAGED